MTRDELYQILRNYVGRDAEALHAVEEIWGQLVKVETEKIKPVTEQSSATLSESFPDGTTYTDRRDSKTPNQPQ